MVLREAYFVNQIVESHKDSRSKDKGIYAITTKKDLELVSKKGYLEIGTGDSKDIDSRIYKGHVTSKNVAEDIVEVGRWTDLQKIRRDYDIFDDLSLIAPRRVGINRAGKQKKHELFRLPIAKAIIEAHNKNGEYDDIKKYAFKEWDRIIKKKEKITKTQLIKFRDIQDKVIKRIIKKLQSQGFEMSIVAELCPRIGKTIIFLELFKQINKKNPKFKTMVVKAYGVGLSIFKSYKDEVDTWKDFMGMDIIDSQENPNAEQDFKKSQKQGRIQVVLVSLNPEESNKKYKWIHDYTGPIISLLEETDFGSHTEKQVRKIEYLNANKKKLIRFNTSGTNIGRVAKAMGKNEVSDTIVVPYAMVEQDRDASKNGIVIRRYYNAVFGSKVNKLLEGYGAEDLPTIRKIIEKPWAQEAFLGAVWGDLLGSSTARTRYGMNLNQMAEEDLKYIMAFQSGTKKSMNQHKEVIEKYCPEVYVLVLHGDVRGMCNKTAQQMTKEKIVELKNGMIPGKNKLIVLTNMMGSRSYTVGEIQAVLFMQDGGDVNTFIQKSSRVLSPFPGKKFGHIFDFAFDPNKTRNTEMAIVHDAVLTQVITGKPFPKCLRQVLNSVNLYDMDKGGWQSNDQMMVRLEDNNKLLALANSVNIDIKTLSKNIIDILLRVKGSLGKKEIEKIKKTINTGKTFGNAGGFSKKEIDFLLSKVKKAIKSLNNSATSVYHFANHEGNTFSSCIDEISKCKESSIDFEKVFGIAPSEIKVLMPILPTNIFDVCIQNSKKGYSQKYAMNKELGILGEQDSPELWNKIISQAVLDVRIRYALKNKGKILVVAGGHGTEVDILVEKYGKGIVKHIWFNDIIISFTNEAKRKYNKINILKGDFLSLNILMKFDVILGNPPYQSQKESTGDDIWPLFVQKAMDLLNKDGIVAMITPHTWLRRQGGDTEIVESLGIDGNHLPKRSNPVWKIWLENTIRYARILTDEEAEKYFPNIGSTFSYYLLEKKKPKTTIIEVVKGKNKVKMEINSPFSPPKELNESSMSIHKKLIEAEKFRWIRTTENRKDNLTRYNALSDKLTKKNKNKIYMGVDLVRYTDRKMKYFDNAKIMVPITGQPKNIFVDKECGVSQDLSFLCFDTIKEAEQVLEKFQSNDLIQYIFKAYKVGKHISAHIMVPKNIESIVLTKEEEEYISNF